jgi:molecular chaperone DnaJ
MDEPGPDFTMSDHYQALGVARDASAEEIKQAFRRCAMKHHPDRNPGDAEAEARFKACKAAYDVLGDQQRRKTYDQGGETSGLGGWHAAGNGQGFAMDDIFQDLFEQVFAGGGHSRRPRGRGLDIVMNAAMPLETSILGGKAKISFTSQVICTSCAGSGAHEGATHTCKTCAGSGETKNSGLFAGKSKCVHCKGTGKTATRACATCKGQGRLAKERTLEVDIPAGIDQGQRIRVVGQGQAGMQGEPAGDLLIDVSLLDHPVFKRQGLDLLREVKVRMTQAALGATLSVDTPLGPVSLDIPAGTQPGTVLGLAGRGVRAGGRAGTLYCQVAIQMPATLTTEQKSLLEQLDAALSPSGA